MSLLTGKLFRNLQTDQVVEVIDTKIGVNMETATQFMSVRFATECGAEALCEIESFILDFERVEDVSSVTWTAPTDDVEFWKAVLEFAEEHGVEMEEDDEAPVAEAVHSEARLN